MAETAQADDRHLLAGAGLPVTQRRVERDAGAKQRCGSIERKVLRNGEHIAFLDDDMVGIAALGRGSVGLDAVVGHHEARQILLQVEITLGAGRAGVDEAADTHPVADLEPGDLGADCPDDADDLVARYHGEGRIAPFVARLVDVGMADAAIFDVDHHVVVARFATLEGEGCERLRRVRRRISSCNGHGSVLHVWEWRAHWSMDRRRQGGLCCLTRPLR
ncbi:hypothetical protein ACVINY_003731 [Sinorhizobium meliloti]